MEGYRDAWERRDPAAAAALFSEDSLYREQPYQPPYPGREGVRDYWTTVTATQEDVRVRYGSPVSVGNRAAVEWWVTMRNGGADITLAGEFMLTFDDGGLCQECVSTGTSARAS